MVCEWALQRGAEDEVGVRGGERGRTALEGLLGLHHLGLGSEKHVLTRSRGTAIRYTLVVFVVFAAGHRLEQFERGGLGGGDEHFATEILELREEAGVHGDLVAARIFEDDHGAALVLVRDAFTAPDRSAGGGEHRDRDVMPMRERILALRIGHLL